MSSRSVERSAPGNGAGRKRVLDVGQCQPDHSSLRRLLERFGAEVLQAHGLGDTVAQLRAGPFDLVMINRKLDVDYSDGMAILKHLKQDPATKSTPVILISNYADAQAEAIAAGAEPGFGKAQLSEPATHEILERLLGAPAA